MTQSPPPNPAPRSANSPDPAADLGDRIMRLAPRDAKSLIEPLDNSLIVAALQKVSASVAENVLWRLPESRRLAILSIAPSLISKQWSLNHNYPENSIGRMMDPPIGVFPPDTTARQAIEQLREQVKHAFITYGLITDSEKRLLGILVMRDLMLADPDDKLSAIMLPNPFFLQPEMTLLEAMRKVIDRHYPVYPVCDSAGHLLGLVRGQTLFQHEAIEISAQAGEMVGVEKEERLATPWPRSLRYRHPWLQLNLLTAFLAAGVVSCFSDTIARIGVLAAFIPVLNGQSANTGCQSLAVSLRGLILGELRKPGQQWPVVIKEAVLGAANGFLVGLVAALGMIFFAHGQHAEHPYKLAAVVFLAMTASCFVAGITGALVPAALRKLGFDPATASSIFLTTVTDVASTAALLGLATLFVH